MIIAAPLRLNMAEARTFDLILPKLPGAQVLGMEGVRRVRAGETGVEICLGGN